MIENWIDIKGTDGLYRVSDLGRIELMRDVVIKPLFGDLYIKESGLISVGKHPAGYNNYWLAGAKKIERRGMLYRLVAEHFILNPENKPCINHKNGVKNDNRAVNLEWNTYSENSKHAIRTGLHKPVRNTHSLKMKLNNH